MLAHIRNTSGSWFIKIFLVLLALSFITWGIGDYLNGSMNMQAVKVGSVNITAQDLGRQYQQNLQQVESQFNQKLSEDMIEQLKLRERTLNNLVQSALFLNNAKEIGLRASDENIRHIISTDPTFQDDSGQFDNELYNRILSSAGYTKEGYENKIRRALLSRTISDIFKPASLPQGLINKHLAFNKETVDINTFSISIDDIKDVASPSNEEVQAYFEQYKSDYMTEETRDIDIISFSKDTLKNKITITEEETLARYEESPEFYTVPEQRQAHILVVETEDEAISLRDDIASEPTAFERIAKKHSKDPLSAMKGGDLGLFAYTDIPEEIADVAFDLNAGEISEPATMGEQYFVLMLDKIVPEKDRSFEEAREDVLADIKTERVETLYEDMLVDIDDRIASGESFKAISEGLKIDRKSYTDISANNPELSSFGQELALQAFTLDEGYASTPIYTGETVYFVQATSISPSREMALAEATDKIVDDMRIQAIHRQIISKTSQALAQRMEGKNLKSIAQEMGLDNSFVSYKNVQRNSENAPDWIKPNFLPAVFALNAGDVLKNTVPTKNGLAVIEVTKRGQDEVTDAEKASYKDQMASIVSYDLQSAYNIYLQDETKVKYDNRIISATFGASNN